MGGDMAESDVINQRLAFKRYLMVEQSFKPALINLILNGLIAWVVFRSAVRMTFWSESAIGTDLLLTAFLLPFIVAMVNLRVVANKARKGELVWFNELSFTNSGLSRRSILFLSVILGCVGVIVFAGPALLVLPWFWPEPLQLWDYVVFKSVWAAVLAALICPIIAVWALQRAGQRN